MKKKFFLFFIFICLTVPLAAQSIKSLEAQKKKTLEELAITNKLLNEARKNKKGTVNRIGLLNRSISQSSKVIDNLNNEISILDNNIDSLQSNQAQLQAQLENVKKDYAKMVESTYLYNKYFSPLLFILSSNDFSQAYRRYRYLQEASNYRKRQVLEIDSLTNQLAREEHMLSQNKKYKQNVINSKEQESNRLESQKNEQFHVLADLKQQESDLVIQQRKQQQRASRLNSRIQALIAEEVQKENDRKKAAGAKSSTNGEYPMSKEDKLFTGNFAKNKGHLPMPVEKGIITGHFGLQQHPVLPNVTVDNKGIYIQTSAGSDARAVYDGVVTECFTIPGSNGAIIVKHGNYRTVYANLSQFYVKVGDKVVTKQRLGKIFTDTENGNKTELYFSIYQNTTIQNPEDWLAL